jgi:heme exporter protein CcmD
MTDQIAEYLDMGGYARYVWPSYAIVTAAILLNIHWARRALKRARIEAARRLAIREKTVEGRTEGPSIEGNAS